MPEAFAQWFDVFTKAQRYDRLVAGVEVVLLSGCGGTCAEQVYLIRGSLMDEIDAGMPEGEREVMRLAGDTGDGEPIQMESLAITEAELAEIGAMRLNQLDRIEALVEALMLLMGGRVAVDRADAELERKRIEKGKHNA